MHQNLPLLLNSAAWRSGDDCYYAKTFPNSDSIVYASMSLCELSFFGFPNKDEHFSTCHTCAVTAGCDDNNVSVYQVGLLTEPFSQIQVQTDLPDGGLGHVSTPDACVLSG